MILGVNADLEIQVCVLHFVRPKCAVSILVLNLLRVLMMKGIKRSVILHLNVSEKIYGPSRTNLDKMRGLWSIPD